MGLLIDERPLVLLPSLVALVGLERSIILQQVHFATNQPRSGKVLEDGFRYVWNTYEEWQRDHFPFWSPEAIRKHFTKLEEQDLIVARKPNAQQRDHTKYYRVNEIRLKALCTASVTDSQSDSNRPPSPNPIRTETSSSETSSVPKGTGVPPPASVFGPNLGQPSLLTSSIEEAESPRVSQTPQEFVWGEGVQFLTRNGATNFRGVLGEFMRDHHHEDVVTMLKELPEHRLDYVPYMKQVMKKYLPKDAKLKTNDELRAEREQFANSTIALPPTLEEKQYA